MQVKSNGICLSLTPFSTIPSRSIHVVIDGKISFLFMAEPNICILKIYYVILLIKFGNCYFMVYDIYILAYSLWMV